MGNRIEGDKLFIDNEEIKPGDWIQLYEGECMKMRYKSVNPGSEGVIIIDKTYYEGYEEKGEFEPVFTEWFLTDDYIKATPPKVLISKSSSGRNEELDKILALDGNILGLKELKKFSMSFVVEQMHKGTDKKGYEVFSMKLVDGSIVQGKVCLD